MKLFKNKKGDSGQEEMGIAPMIVVSLLIAGLLIIAATFIFYGPFKMFFTNPEKQISQNTLNDLTTEINGLLTNPEELEYIKSFPLTISKETVIVGFDKKWTDQNVDTCDNAKYEPIKKPKECGESACLCLYEVASGARFENNKLIECKTFQNVNTFATLNYYNNEQSYKNVEQKFFRNFRGTKRTLQANEYSYLLMYGNCVYGKEIPLETALVTIIKYVHASGNIIFIVDDSDETLKKEFLEKYQNEE